MSDKPRYEDMIFIESRVAQALGRSIEEIRKMDLRELAEVVYDRGLEMKISFPDHNGGPYHMLMKMADIATDPDEGVAPAA